jgi:hypothetical protein
MQCDDVVDGEGGKETAVMIDVLAQAKKCCGEERALIYVVCVW